MKMEHHMSLAVTALSEWTLETLIDPRGKPPGTKSTATRKVVDAWPINGTPRKIGLFSNKKPNADAMLEEVRRGLSETAPGLSFVYGSKEPLAEHAPDEVIARLKECDVVVLASAECGGCTSWVCRDYIALEKLGVPCMLIATHRFEALARAVLAEGGIASPHMAVAQHPVSGISAERAQAKIREISNVFAAQLLGADAAQAGRH
jgi:hypothetical protein